MKSSHTCDLFVVAPSRVRQKQATIARARVRNRPAEITLVNRGLLLDKNLSNSKSLSLEREEFLLEIENS